MGRKDYQSSQFTCSFCGKNQREVRKLIAGPTVYVCDECVRLCNDIIHEEKNRTGTPSDPRKLPTPSEICVFLDQYVVGQQAAKKTLAVAVYNHYKRVNEKSASTVSEDPTEIFKSNVLLVGPTGTGKTLLAQSLARMLNVPFTIADATTLTEAGYVGEDVESIISNLLAAADNDVQKAERGIIYIDEIDKIARRGDSPSLTRDVSGEGVQQALLKIIEGTRANVPPRGAKKYGQTEMVQVDTSNILVICGGSFHGITQIIGQRLGKRGLGFGSDIRGNAEQDTGDLLKQLEPQDLSKFGLIPEFIGRLPVLTTLEDLRVADLTKILTEPKNALIRQYQKLFAMERVELQFEPEAIVALAEGAIANHSGARGLRAILENAMLEIMYEVPFLDGIKRCVITKDVILGQGAPQLAFEAKKSA